MLLKQKMPGRVEECHSVTEQLIQSLQIIQLFDCNVMDYSPQLKMWTGHSAGAWGTFDVDK